MVAEYQQPEAKIPQSVAQAMIAGRLKIYSQRFEQYVAVLGALSERFLRMMPPKKRARAERLADAACRELARIGSLGQCDYSQAIHNGCPPAAFEAIVEKVLAAALAGDPEAQAAILEWRTAIERGYSE